jgi:hypothetical protein
VGHKQRDRLYRTRKLGQSPVPLTAITTAESQPRVTRPEPGMESGHRFPSSDSGRS